MTHTLFDELIEDLKNCKGNKLLLTDSVVMVSFYHPNFSGKYNRLWTLHLFELDINSSLTQNQPSATLRYLNIMKNEYRNCKVDGDEEIEPDGFFKATNRYVDQPYNYLLVSLLEDSIGESLHDNWYKWAKE